jgi:hypothetical protein
MVPLPVFSESALPFFALGFGVVSFLTLKIWGRILEHRREYYKASTFTHGRAQPH